MIFVQYSTELDEKNCLDENIIELRVDDTSIKELGIICPAGSIPKFV